MMREYTLYSTGQTAALLQLTLGDCRSWSDFLADCIRFKTCFEGLRLTPRFESRFSRRPKYAGADIREFIEAVWEKRPDLKRKHQIKGEVVEFAPASPAATPGIRIHPCGVGKFNHRKTAPGLWL